MEKHLILSAFLALMTFAPICAQSEGGLLVGLEAERIGTIGFVLYLRTVEWYTVETGGG